MSFVWLVGSGLLVLVGRGSYFVLCFDCGSFVRSLALVLHFLSFPSFQPLPRSGNWVPGRTGVDGGNSKYWLLLKAWKYNYGAQSAQYRSIFPGGMLELLESYAPVTVGIDA